ncbi:unnamed protein product [Phytophthora fragariaefolia]|uniref:Unnamed protein product n=1 Tax=Phytophthora fragariaefolia TaxID=1490495 RepID=A0A9W6XS96_9STRA|nr:unnamed protein product [Phytophthora fragariaefolia]
MFQVRQYYSYVVMTFLAVQQFRTSVRDLPYPNWNALRNTVIVAALTIAVLYGFALWIGFPVPFSIVVVMPVWVAILSVAMAIEWLRPIQQNPRTGTMVFNTIKVWLCEVLLVVTYPPYFYVFTTLSKTGQMFFASLLPVIKLVMRNIFTLTVVHLSDEMPEVVVFNSEGFNALFVSYCMQNSPSIGTTMMVTAALLVQLVMSLRDVNEAVRRMDKIGRQLTHEAVSSKANQGILKSSVGGHVVTCLERAQLILLDQQEVFEKHEVQPSNIKHTRSSTAQRLHAGQPSETSHDNPLAADPDFNVESHATEKLRGGGRIHPAPEGPTKDSDPKEITATSLRYVLEVRRLLYLTEFIVLINYVGVFIPLIFCK